MGAIGVKSATSRPLHQPPNRSMVQNISPMMVFCRNGSAASAFLTRIDDVANEGGGGSKKNWQLWVNTSYADKSFGVYEVQPLDVVFWRFTTQEGK